MTALLDAPTAPQPTAPPTSTGPASTGVTGTLAMAKGWHDDPWHSHALRYHDGTGWTDHVTHFGPVPCLTSCRHTH